MNLLTSFNLEVYWRVNNLFLTVDILLPICQKLTSLVKQKLADICIHKPLRVFNRLYCTVLYCTVLYCTVLYCTVLYCTEESAKMASILKEDFKEDFKEDLKEGLKEAFKEAYKEALKE